MVPREPPIRPRGGVHGAARQRAGPRVARAARPAAGWSRIGLRKRLLLFPSVPSKQPLRTMPGTRRLYDGAALSYATGHLTSIARRGALQHRAHATVPPAPYTRARTSVVDAELTDVNISWRLGSAFLDHVSDKPWGDCGVLRAMIGRTGCTSPGGGRFIAAVGSEAAWQAHPTPIIEDDCLHRRTLRVVEAWWSKAGCCGFPMGVFSAGRPRI